MSNRTDWIQSEIKLWQREGLIDQSTSQLLSARYPPVSGRSWGLFLLTAIGAIVFGLGVILFFAYNWADLPKFAKLAMIFFALAGFHLLGWHRSVRHPDQRNLVEGFHVIGTMMCGAGIFLIAQIYHMDEHYPNAFLIWGLAALLFGWVLPSAIQAIIATVLIGAWGVSEIIDFHDLHVGSPALVALGIMPLAWTLRSRVLLLFSLVVAIALMLLNTAVHISPEIMLYVLFAVAVLLIAISYVVDRTEFPQASGIFRLVGVFIYGVLLFAMTFGYKFLDKMPPIDTGLEKVLLWGSLGSAVVVWCVLCIYGLKAGFEKTKSLQQGLVLLSALIVIQQATRLFPGNHLAFSLIYDAILAAHCILLIIRGTDHLRWWQVAVGCIVLAILLFARFNDLFHSLLMRSLVFVLLGALLFFIGHIYSQRKLREQHYA